MEPLIRKVSASKNVSGLVLLLNDFQMVRMVELLRAFGIFGLYQRRRSYLEGAGVKKQENMLGWSYEYVTK